MARQRSLFSTFFILLFIASISLPMVAFAWDDDDDDMTFDVDDVEPIDDSDMTFAPTDAAKPAVSADAPSIAVVTIPGPDLQGADRIAVQNELRRVMDTIPNVVVYGESAVLPALEDRGALTCAREALCLAGIGRNAGVDRIIQARVSRGDGGYRLDIDYFDVADRLFLRYHSSPGLSNMNAVVARVQPGLHEIFNIRGPRGPDPYADDRDVDIKRIMAYTTGGLSVITFGSAIYFGTRVSAARTELEGFERNNNGHYTNLTQVEAQNRVRDMEGNALAANVLYGLTVLLGGASALLFIIEGDDAEAQVNLDTPWHKRIQVTPSVSVDGAGVGARLNF
ncbi:MAG: hypothetical protein ACNA8W_04660 [Bradymonadaceae bacterium]